jgi:hypothetical protein
MDEINKETGKDPEGGGPERFFWNIGIPLLIGVLALMYLVPLFGAANR